MSHFVRLVYNDIVDFFVHKAEGIRYCIYEFLQDSPYLLRHRKLDCLTAYLPEEFSDGFVIRKTSSCGEKIILDCAYRGSCYLGGEGVALAFAESQMSLTVLEHHFQRPTAGIYFPSLGKVKRSVSCKHSVPTAMIGSSCQENTYFDTSENRVILDIVATQSAAVFLQFLLFAFLDKLGCGKLLAPDLVFCAALLSDLYHAEPMACDMKTMYEPHYLFVGEPAVGKHILEFEFMPDGTADHLFGQFHFRGIVGCFALIKQRTRLFANLSFLKLSGTHAIVALPAFLPKKFEFKEQLGNAVRDSHCQTFESKYRLVAQMGMDTADFLYHAARFLMVCIIQDKTDILSFVVGAHPYLVPKLEAYTPHGFPPVHIGIGNEPIESILVCGHERCQGDSTTVNAGYFLHSEKRHHQQTLENTQKPVDLVAFADHAYGISFCHLDRSEDVSYILHCCRHIGFFEKSFDIREKRRNFVYRHGDEFVFSLVPKFTHFLQYTQETMSFFYTLISSILYLRNLNNITTLITFSKG